MKNGIRVLGLDLQGDVKSVKGSNKYCYEGFKGFTKERWVYIHAFS